MAVDAATLEADMVLAVAAIKADDWATAMPLLRACHATISVIPDSRLGEMEMKWDRASIAALIQDGKAATSASTSIQRQRITYAAPAD